MNKPAVIASTLTVAALGFALWAHVALRRAEATMRDLGSERTRLTGELRNTQQRLDAAHQRLVQAELQAASLKEDFGQLFSKKDALAPAIGATGKPSQGFATGGFRRGGLPLFRSPPPAKTLETTYHVLYRQLKLSPGQIEGFKAIMTAATARFEDLEREARQKRVSVMDRTMQPLYAQADSDLRASLISHLGAGALPVMEHFTETLFLRDAVSHVASELFYTDDPLTEPQANQLVDILAKNMRDPAGRLNPTFADGTAMKAEADPTLSPPQRVVWQEFIDYLAKTAFASLQSQRR